MFQLHAFRFVVDERLPCLQPLTNYKHRKRILQNKMKILEVILYNYLTRFEFKKH